MPNDLLAELAQVERIDFVKQANADERGADRRPRPLRRQRRPAGARSSTSAARAASSSPATSSATRCAAWSTSPAARAELDAGLHDLYEALSVTTNPIPVKAALELLGLCRGALRLPLVAPDEHELAVVRAALERHGLLEAAHR